MRDMPKKAELWGEACGNAVEYQWKIWMILLKELEIHVESADFRRRSKATYAEISSQDLPFAAFGAGMEMQISRIFIPE